MLERVFDVYQRYDDPGQNARARADFAFHMSDWEENLKELAALFEDHTKFDKEAAAQIVYSFIIHVGPHLVEATRVLLGDFHDTFAEMKQDD